MMSVLKSAKVLKEYLDESAEGVPPKVYEAISDAVAVMDAFGPALDAAAGAVVTSAQTIAEGIKDWPLYGAVPITGALVHVEGRDGR